MALRESNSGFNPNTYPRRSTSRIYNDMEFLAEHFGFLPVEMLDELYNGYNMVCYRFIDALEDFLKSYSTLKSLDYEENLKEFEINVEKTLDKYFNIFQKYVFDHILRLPRNKPLQLDHYQGLDLMCTDEQEDLVDQELAKARRSLMSQKAFRHILRNKLTKLDQEMAMASVKEQLILSWLQIARDNNVYPVHDSARFVAEQAERLRKTILEVIQRIRETGAFEKLTSPDERTQHILNTVQLQLNAYRHNHHLNIQGQ
ncbi:hypothetical protein BX666DRAFT_1929706 [Dichotomocladium elegans]|nr:hypothetical protein BX666DRAFT_1929706 [Dichotomocladium elegans]